MAAPMHRVQEKSLGSRQGALALGARILSSPPAGRKLAWGHTTSLAPESGGIAALDVTDQRQLELPPATGLPAVKFADSTHGKCEDPRPPAGRKLAFGHTDTSGRGVLRPVA